MEELLIEIEGGRPRLITEKLKTFMNRLAQSRPAFIEVKVATGPPLYIRKDRIITVHPVSNGPLICPECGNREFDLVRVEGNPVVGICGHCGVQRIQRC